MVWEAWVRAVAEEIAADGIRGHERDVCTFAGLSRAWSVPTVLIDVLVDQDAPEVARQRAFARIASFTVNRPRTADRVRAHERTVDPRPPTHERRLPLRPDVPVGVSELTVDA